MKTLQNLRNEDAKTRAEWLKKRSKGVGASETAGVLGVSPWASPLSVYVDKIGTVKDEPLNEDQIERQRWGHLLEGPVIDELELRTGLKIRRAPQTRITRHSRWPTTPMFATPDAYVIEEARRLCQVKTTSAWNAKEWDEGVPLHVRVQVQSEMAVCDRDGAIVVALVGGQKLVWYEIERNQKFIDQLEPAITSFWYDYVQRRVIPPADGSSATVRALEQLHPDDNGEEIVLPEKSVEIYEELTDIKADLKRLKKRREELENEVKAMIGPATFGRLPSGSGRFSWKTQERKAYSVKASTHRRLWQGK